ncbi:hypothetical protein SAMN05444412_107177 [Rhodonellum ikkaensis]|uniref:Uncharacterized protein n=1 Tax=Rhodonellum ikkaensis TaxID=336829 RepID=A0A1H3R520_9BACT|nr:hypothetical protein SAMN05444412_107177 [Rhodonellum ikkaensis]
MYPSKLEDKPLLKLISNKVICQLAKGQLNEVFDFQSFKIPIKRCLYL